MAEQETQDVIVRPKLDDVTAVVHDDGEYAMLFDSARFNQAQRVAKVFAESKLVPDHFRGSAASVLVALHMAMRMQLDPMMVMQKTYIIHGKPGMEAQLLIALVNARGPFTGPIQWEFSGEGENRQCTAYAIHRQTNERCEVTITWKMVKAEGWAGKAGSKWMTIPDLMFRYRSATYLARLYCPEVIMGLSTVDELKDIDPEVVEATFEPVTPAVPQTEKVKEKLRGRKKPPETPPTEMQSGLGVMPEPEQINAADAATEALDPVFAELAKVPEDILLKAYKAAKVDWRPVAELDLETAQLIVGYARLL